MIGDRPDSRVATGHLVGRRVRRQCADLVEQLGMVAAHHEFRLPLIRVNQVDHRAFGSAYNRAVAVQADTGRRSSHPEAPVLGRARSRDRRASGREYESFMRECVRRRPP